MRTNKLGGLLRTYGGWDVLKNKVFPSLGIVSQSMAMNFYSQGEITTRIFFGWNMSSELEHRGKPSLSLRQGNVPTIILFASLCHFWRHAQGKNGKIPKSQAWLGYFTSAHLGRRPCIQIGGAVCGSTCPLHIFHSCLSCLSYLHEEHWKRRFAFKKIGRTAGWKPCECRHFHAFAVELNVSMACWEQNRLNTRQVRATLQDGCILHGNMREFGDTGGSPRRRCLFMSFPLNRSLIAVYPGTILSGDRVKLRTASPMSGREPLPIWHVQNLIAKPFAKQFELLRLKWNDRFHIDSLPSKLCVIRQHLLRPCWLPHGILRIISQSLVICKDAVMVSFCCVIQFCFVILVLLCFVLVGPIDLLRFLARVAQKDQRMYLLKTTENQKASNFVEMSVGPRCNQRCGASNYLAEFLAVSQGVEEFFVGRFVTGQAGWVEFLSKWQGFTKLKSNEEPSSLCTAGLTITSMLDQRAKHDLFLQICLCSYDDVFQKGYLTHLTHLTLIASQDVSTCLIHIIRWLLRPAGLRRAHRRQELVWASAASPCHCTTQSHLAQQGPPLLNIYVWTCLNYRNFIGISEFLYFCQFRCVLWKWKMKKGPQRTERV